MCAAGKPLIAPKIISQRSELGKFKWMEAYITDWIPGYQPLVFR